jgi:hypothetical protein
MLDSELSCDDRVNDAASEGAAGAAMIPGIRRIARGSRTVASICLAATLLLAAAAGGDAMAQDLTPRTYWPAPKDTQLLIAGYTHQSGDIVTDPSIPVTGVDSSIDTVALAYQRTVDLLGRTANVRLQVPLVDGTSTGAVGDVSGRRDVRGFGDVTATLTINLLGAPSMSPADFQRLRQAPRPILGASIKVVAPTGEYDNDKLINIGSNRWAAQAQIGFIYPFSRKWLLETIAGVWFFGDNDEFLGRTREQDPIAALNLHLVRRFSAGFWASLDLNYYTGGRSTIDGVSSPDLQRNSRAGVNLAYPFRRRHALKLGISGGVVTESGGDYRTIALTYIYVIG